MHKMIYTERYPVHSALDEQDDENEDTKEFFEEIGSSN